MAFQQIITKKSKIKVNGSQGYQIGVHLMGSSLQNVLQSRSKTWGTIFIPDLSLLICMLWWFNSQHFIIEQILPKN